MYSTKMEHSAWTLGIQASISAQTSLHEFSLTLAPCSGHRLPSTNTDVPPDPLHLPPAARGPFVHLCFINPLGVISVVITAPSIMKVPFGIVTRLSRLAWVVMFEWWPCWFHPAFYWICKLSCNCGYSRLVAISPFLNCYTFVIFILKVCIIFKNMYSIHVVCLSVRQTFAYCIPL